MAAVNLEGGHSSRQEECAYFELDVIGVRLCGSAVINIEGKVQWQVDTAMGRASLCVTRVREAVVE